jgi:hypothetical protein
VRHLDALLVTVGRICLLHCCFGVLSVLCAAEDRREQAEELLELADAVADAAKAAEIAAAQPILGIKWQQKQHTLAPHGVAAAAAAGSGSAAAGNTAAGPGALPDALTAAQQLLAFGGVHVANVPGLGFTQVVSAAAWAPQSSSWQ